MLVTLTNKGAALARIELNSPRYCDIDHRNGYLGHLVMEPRGPGKGCLVQVVGPGTPAAEAGLKPGDVIKSVDGKPVDRCSSRSKRSWQRRSPARTMQDRDRPRRQGARRSRRRSAAFRWK